VTLLDSKVDVDATLTQRISCIVCEKNLTCFAENIELFDPRCLYSKNKERPVTRMRVIKY